MLKPISEKESFLVELAKADLHFEQMITGAVTAVQIKQEEALAFSRLWAFMGRAMAFNVKEEQCSQISRIADDLRSAGKELISLFVKESAGGMTINFDQSVLLDHWLTKQTNQYHDPLLKPIDGTVEMFEASLAKLNESTLTGLYARLERVLGGTKALDILYGQAAVTIQRFFRFDTTPKMVKGRYVFDKTLYGVDTQYSHLPGQYKLNYGYRAEFVTLQNALKAFESYSTTSSLSPLILSFLRSMENSSDGFDLRDVVEYSNHKIVFFKSKLELHIDIETCAQLVAFTRIHQQAAAA